MDISERRLVENETIFRDANRQIKEMASRVLGQAQKTVIPVGFYCECSDRDCRERIELTPEEFDEVHSIANQFVIKCGHEILRVEDIVEVQGDYCIIQKHFMPEDLV
ncbi:MAG TPA: hypothetical protein VGH44_03770 [Candidatus Saccharimonadia bacterium]